MAAQERYQPSGNAAEIYERQKVPAIFAPLALATLEQVTVRADEWLLDVACGTGIMARNTVRLVGPDGRVVGVDLNAAMLEVAQQMASTLPDRIEWHEADICALPFDDSSFDIAFCQQGLQYLPDKPAALEEIRRVLTPGGRLVVTVWNAVSPLFEAIAGSLSHHVGPKTAARALAPFAFRDGDIIRSLIEGAGFTRVSARNLRLDRMLAATETSVPEEIRSSPYAAEVERAGPTVMSRIAEDTAKALAPFREGSGFRVPQWSHLFEARSGSPG